MRKSEELTLRDSCFRKAGLDEPLFVLRAKDLLAPETVRYWANQALARGVPDAKIASALVLVEQMEAWQCTNAAKMPD